MSDSTFTLTLPPLHPYQKVAKDFIVNNPFCALYLDMGLGKACDDNTLVPNPDGTPHRLGNIIPGDRVFTPQGVPTTVTAVYHHQHKSAFKVHLNDGRSFICCDEHLIPVTNPHLSPDHPHYMTPVMLKHLVDLRSLRCDDPTSYAIPHTPVFLPPQAAVNYPQSTIQCEYNLDSYDYHTPLNHPDLLLASLDQRWGVFEYIRQNHPTDMVTLYDSVYAFSFPASCWQDAHRFAALTRSLGLPTSVEGDITQSYEQPAVIKVETSIQAAQFYMPLITHVSRLSPRSMTCLTVDDPSHCFLIEDYIPTHNTLTTLSALAEINPRHNVLVVAPLAIAQSTWPHEIKKWNLPIRTRSFIVDEHERKRTPQQRQQLYEQARREAQEGIFSLYFVNRELVPKLVEMGPWLWPTVILDEAQSFKNPSSKRFKALRSVRPHIERIVELTGTPAPAGVEDLWSQIFLLDQGKRLCPTLTKFRQRFFTPAFPMVNGVVVKWDIRPGADEEIFSQISDLVISMKNTELDLPELTLNDIYVTLSEQEAKFYHTLKKDMILALEEQTPDHDDEWADDSDDNPHPTFDIVSAPPAQDDMDADEDNPLIIEASTAAVLALRLTQLASGTVYPSHYETLPSKMPIFNTQDYPAPASIPPQRRSPQYAVLSRAKLNMLAQMRESIDSPLLVAYHFRSECDMIVRFCEENDIPVAVFDGSPTMVERWNEGHIPLLLIQPASAGHGLNFQDGGHHLIWFSLPWSLEEYLQTNARLHRQGQKHPVIIHRLLTKDTMDEKIAQVLASKDASQQKLLDAVYADMSAYITQQERN